MNGFHRPALEAITQKLVARDELAAVSALASLRGTTAAIAGPSLAGLSIAAFGLPITYSIEVATFAVSVAALAAIRAMPPAETAQPAGIGTILEGLRYAGSRPELIGTYAVDIVAMTFAMPMAVFPALAEQLGGTATVGFLYSAMSIGALLVTIFSGWTRNVERRGAAVVVAAALWGVAIVGLGFATSLSIAVGLPRARGRRRHGQRLVSDDDLERDDPADAARAHGEHRAALVHDGAVARQRARGLHGGAIRAGALDRVGRNHLRRRRHAVRAGVAASSGAIASRLRPTTRRSRVTRRASQRQLSRRRRRAPDPRERPLAAQDRERVVEPEADGPARDGEAQRMHELADLEVPLGHERLELLLERRRLEAVDGLEPRRELAQQRDGACGLHDLVEVGSRDGQRVVGDEELAELQDVAHRLDAVAGRRDDAREVRPDAGRRRRRHEAGALQIEERRRHLLLDRHAAHVAILERPELLRIEAGRRLVDALEREQLDHLARARTPRVLSSSDQPSSIR